MNKFVDDSLTLSQAREEVRELPLEELNPANPTAFQNNTMWATFERLRREAPVHYAREHNIFGPYWSLSKFQTIKQVDTDHENFSSDKAITLFDAEEGFELPMFIAMDRPKHDRQRREVSPVVAPRNLAAMAETIRTRAAAILDNLPVGETFDWVDNVSIELTTQMLATLFDFPFEERRKLTRWSDVATGGPQTGIVESNEQRRDELMECLNFFTQLWNERVNQPPGNDLVSMLAHGEGTQNMPPFEYLGNLLLLIVGGNDTTRNSISGGVIAFNKHPDQLDKLRENRELVPNAVAEIIRWQTPLAYMRRTALRDIEVEGQKISAGEKVAMWYLSGNRDEEVFDNPDDIQVDRPNARQHVAFGYGIHRCMGNRLAEMQLRILWEEILKRFEFIEVMGPPKRNYSAFVKGYTELPVRLHPLRS